MVELLAVAAAFMYSTADVMVKKGLQGSNAVTATVVSQLVTGSLFLLLFLLFVPFGALDSRSVFYFMAAGVLAPGLFRFLYYTGVNRLGVAVSSPIVNAYSLVAILTAIVVLDERLTSVIALSTLAILAGAYLLTRGGGAGNLERAARKRRRLDLLFPLAAMVVRGFSEVFRKTGLLAINSPILGAAVANVTGCVFTLAFMGLSGKLRGTFLLPRRSLGYFLCAGIAVTTAWVLAFSALAGGALVRVTPLLTSTPLFTLLIGYFFLRGIERITPRIAIGAVLIVAGILFMKLGS